jgi:putative ABC transport system ATP-binding protein
MTAGTRVVLEDVTKSYETDAGAVLAVDGVSLDVPAGTSLSITGPSGCGKSTLLGLIGGLDRPTRGRVSIGERTPSETPRPGNIVRRRGIGLVFQSDDLLPFLTAVENVDLQLGLDGDRDVTSRGRDLLAELGLGAECDLFPDQLSGGQRQRVAVARALVHRPGLIVADEPTGSLDAETSEAVVDLLLSAQRVGGTTLVLVTHEHRVAGRLDRTIEMRDGRLVDAADAGPGAPPQPRA